MRSQVTSRGDNTMFDFLHNVSNMNKIKTSLALPDASGREIKGPQYGNTCHREATQLALNFGSYNYFHFY